MCSSFQLVLTSDRIDGMLLSPQYGWGRIDVYDATMKLGLYELFARRRWRG